MDAKPQRRTVDPSAYKQFHALGLRCLFCTNPGVEAHHLLPRARGGDDVLDNFVPLCPRDHQAVHGSAYTRGAKNGRERVTGPIVRRKIGHWLSSEDGLEARAYLAGKLGAVKAKNYALREFGVML